MAATTASLATIAGETALTARPVAATTARVRTAHAMTAKTAVPQLAPIVMIAAVTSVVPRGSTVTSVHEPIVRAPIVRAPIVLMAIVLSAATAMTVRAPLVFAMTVTSVPVVAIVTTANLDRRSYEINFETSVVVYDDAFATEMRRLQQSYIADSDRIDPGAWARRGATARFAENLANLVSPLL